MDEMKMRRTGRVGTSEVGFEDVSRDPSGVITSGLRIIRMRSQNPTSSTPKQGCPTFHFGLWQER